MHHINVGGGGGEVLWVCSGATGLQPAAAGGDVDGSSDVGSGVEATIGDQP